MRVLFWILLLLPAIGITVLLIHFFRNIFNSYFIHWELWIANLMGIICGILLAPFIVFLTFQILIRLLILV